MPKGRLWWYQQDHNYDVRDLMRRSEKLFVPKMNMIWLWKGTSFELVRANDRKVVWSSLTHAVSWSYVGKHLFGALLSEYINTPKEKIAAFESDMHITTGRFCEQDVLENIRFLETILLIADKRVPKDGLSVRLFIEPDKRIRNLIGQRL